MKLLRESFGITQRIHDRYFTEMRQAIPQRDPSKVKKTLLIYLLVDRCFFAASQYMLRHGKATHFKQVSNAGFQEFALLLCYFKFFFSFSCFCVSFKNDFTAWKQINIAFTELALSWTGTVTQNGGAERLITLRG